MNKIISVLAVFCSLSAFASEWKSISIPGAKCGDGLPYRVFYRAGDRDKVSFELMGGGACWSLATCWGPNFRTWIHTIPKLPAFSYLTMADGPLKDYTMVYFPYCNGDVWMGRHTASYTGVESTYHRGSETIDRALEYLKIQGLIDFKSIKSFSIYGSSAGGVGALLHVPKLEIYLPKKAKKLIIADSPGLHWGKNFWHKFTSPMLNDFEDHFAKLGMKLDFNDGLIAPYLKEYCEKFSDWKIGIVQATRDIIMSRMFGNISQEDHEDLVLGPMGVKEVTRNSPNCFAHVIRGQGHAFLLLKPVIERTNDVESEVSTIRFVNSMIEEAGLD